MQHFYFSIEILNTKDKQFYVLPQHNILLFVVIVIGLRDIIAMTIVNQV